MNDEAAHGLKALFVAGVSYRTASVEIRERLAVAHPDRVAVSRHLMAKGGLRELVLLWTCNRVEIYGISGETEPDVPALFECLGREAPILASQVYRHQGLAAAEHLFRVAGGIDSMVLGETQITGQVKQAYEAALGAGLTGKVLNHVFQKALQTAKEIRTRTSIGQGSSSVAGAAVAHAERELGAEVAGRSVLLIGAGQMAASCLKHLQKRGVGEVVVTNRSLDRATALAAEYDGTATAFENLGAALAQADIVVSSTGSPDPILGTQDVASAMAKRNGRTLVIIDIAVPRDVAPEVASLPGVFLHDIDALKSTVSETIRHRSQDLVMCEEIIDRKVAALQRRFGLAPRRDSANHAGNTALCTA
jgi:glutamyl-tRNA reductase